MTEAIDPRAVERFLASDRIALVGASDDPKSFARTIQSELVSHGYDVVPVNPNATEVGGRPCHPDVASVPGGVEAAMVMVGSARAADAVRSCLDAGVAKVWLFRGVGGGAGAATEEAVRMCADAGVEVIPGACPLMFLEPVGWFHKMHRGVRRMKGDLVAVAG